MKIASTTYDFRALNEDHLGRVRHIAKAVFRYVDLSLFKFDLKESPFMKEDWLEYIEKMRSLEKELSVEYVQSHLPCRNPLDESAFDDFCKVTIRAIEVCGLLGIKNAVIHTGWARRHKQGTIFYQE